MATKCFPLWRAVDNLRWNCFEYFVQLDIGNLYAKRCFYVMQLPFSRSIPRPNSRCRSELSWYGYCGSPLTRGSRFVNAASKSIVVCMEEFLMKFFEILNELGKVTRPRPGLKDKSSTHQRRIKLRRGHEARIFWGASCGATDCRDSILFSYTKDPYGAPYSLRPWGTASLASTIICHFDILTSCRTLLYFPVQVRADFCKNLLLPH